jgi:hypothetical protein
MSQGQNDPYNPDLTTREVLAALGLLTLTGCSASGQQGGGTATNTGTGTETDTPEDPEATDADNDEVQEEETSNNSQSDNADGPFSDVNLRGLGVGFHAVPGLGSFAETGAASVQGRERPGFGNSYMLPSTLVLPNESQYETWVDVAGNAAKVEDSPLEPIGAEIWIGPLGNAYAALNESPVEVHESLRQSEFGEPTIEDGIASYEAVGNSEGNFRPAYALLSDLEHPEIGEGTYVSIVLEDIGPTTPNFESTQADPKAARDTIYGLHSPSNKNVGSLLDDSPEGQYFKQLKTKLNNVGEDYGAWKALFRGDELRAGVLDESGEWDEFEPIKI